MAEPADSYDRYYAEKLWMLLPAIYRADDSDDFDRNGPLRELVNRIGAQAAIVRRSMDRMWENQSIETCDDWIIPYIGDLLATNLVATLDGRGQRLDVAKTIYYRRRKGTVSVLEEIAADITGWQARAVEYFHRMGRYRHLLDPPIGPPAGADGTLRALQLAEGLVGPLSGTQIGGWADLRHPYGASKAGTPFDEFFHFGDMRRGLGETGWYNIPHLGIFLWRLYAFPVVEGTPVQVAGCPDVQFTFDPTGREVPLFARLSRPSWDTWVSPAEWQLPGRISKPLLDSILALQGASNAVPYPNPDASLYPESLEVLARAGAFFDSVPPNQLTIWPELGRFRLAPGLGTPELHVSYHYGFPSLLGATAVDRRALRETPVPEPTPRAFVAGGGNGLKPALDGVAGNGTVSIVDSLTYTAVNDPAVPVQVTAVTIRAANRQRPVIRIDSPATGWRSAPPAWTLQGGPNATLTLEGLFLSGCDLVLQGSFDTVLIRQCTLDPGNAGQSPPGGGPAPIFATSLDDRDLAPSRIWVEGEVHRLVLERCVSGPIRTRGIGSIEQLSISDCIVRAIRTSRITAPFEDADLKDAGTLARWLQGRHDPITAYLYHQLPSSTQTPLGNYVDEVTAALAANPPQLPAPEEPLRLDLIDALNAELSDAGLYDPDRFAGVRLSPETQALIATNPAGPDLAHFNRLLLEEAFPAAMADRAIAANAGSVELLRTTILGPTGIHRLSASDCILDGFTVVDDPQHGCLRFSAWTSGSVVPRPYESVEIASDAPIFVSREFGDPAYCQLTSTADLAVLSGPTRATISAGAENGSEMGAYNGEHSPIKARSLQIKFDEYLPVGLVPVVMYVT